MKHLAVKSLLFVCKILCEFSQKKRIKKKKWKEKKKEISHYSEDNGKVIERFVKYDERGKKKKKTIALDGFFNY